MDYRLKCLCEISLERNKLHGFTMLGIPELGQGTLHMSLLLRRAKVVELVCHLPISYSAAGRGIFYESAKE